jgi:ankyrin repeat protein
VEWLTVSSYKWFLYTVEHPVQLNLDFHNMFVVLPGHCEAVRLLLSKGVEVDAINYRGTPLHMTAAKGQHQAMKILLEHGADVS